MTIITLLTDFGYIDGYSGVMKGVIWSIAPQAQIADVTHSIEPQNIYQGALALWRTAKYFPSGTIHVAVVDPGVGTTRRPIAAQIGSQYFVGPDNGIITLILEEAENLKYAIKIVHLNKPEYWLPEVSNVFHARDIFGPIAAHLARGVMIGTLGRSINDPVRLDILKPVETNTGWQGHVVHIDHFGNLSTNLKTSQIDRKRKLKIRLRESEISDIVTTYGQRPEGTLIALIDSSGYLAISIVNGNAAQVLGSRIGDQVEATYLD